MSSSRVCSNASVALLPYPTKMCSRGDPARSRTVGCTRNGPTFLVSMLLSLKIDGNTKHLQINICHVSSAGPGVGCSRSNHL